MSPTPPCLSPEWFSLQTNDMLETLYNVCTPCRPHAWSKSVSVVKCSPRSSPTKAEHLEKGTFSKPFPAALCLCSLPQPITLLIAWRISCGTRSIIPLPSASPNPSTLMIVLTGSVQNGNEREDARSNILHSISVPAVVSTRTVLAPALEHRKRAP